jgi:hypothetical protein
MPPLLQVKQALPPLQTLLLPPATPLLPQVMLLRLRVKLQRKQSRPLDTRPERQLR